MRGDLHSVIRGILIKIDRGFVRAVMHAAYLP